MGCAALYQLCKTGTKVLGIDRFSPPHPFGSTHGETRVTRQAIGEGSAYVPLALRSYEIFRDLEAQTGADLLTVTGGVIISDQQKTGNLHGNSGFIEETIATAQKFGVKHRALSAQQISSEFPHFNLEGNESGYFEDEMAFLRPENCVAAQLGLAEKLGAEIKRNETVLEINNFSDYVEIITDKGNYKAEKLIISVGSWVKELIEKPQQDLFSVYRQVFYWFDIEDQYENFKLANFPIFIWDLGRWENDFFYGFPAIDGKFGGFKMATETYHSTTNPNEVNREISQNEIDEMYENYVKGRINGVSNKIVKTTACLYTVTPKARFVIDYLPSNDKIILASPCSGHGFKHSAAIGEVLSELALTGKSKIDISAFSFEKF